MEEAEIALSGRRKTLIIGAGAGGLLGALFFGGYTAASIWICASASCCSANWLPFILVPAIGLPVSVLAGAVVAIAFRRFYELVRV